jgi:AcrR family transcriptional regulator
MDERDEEWPFPPYPNTYRRPGPASRTEKHQQREAEHIRRHRERGWEPRGRARGLSREEIVRAAITVADAEGPEAISMRRIARELRAGAMSLYWYVGSKEELLDAMLDTLESEINVPEPTGDWRADLRGLAHAQREGWLRHPWIIDFIGSRPPAGPRDARKFEQTLTLFDQLGLEAWELMNALMTFGCYIMGAVMRETQEKRAQQIEEDAEAELTKEELDAQHERIAEWFRSSGRYPRIMRVMQSGIDPDDPKTRDARFEFGLERVLDGISTLLQ